MYADQKARRSAVYEQHKKAREAIRDAGGSAEQRRALYSVAAFQSAARRIELDEQIKSERAMFRDVQRPQSFRGWTTDRAREGNEAAMRQVRGWAYQDARVAKIMQRQDAQAERGPHITTAGSDRRDPIRPRNLTARVTWEVDTRTGSVEYKLDGRDAFRDTGRLIAIGRGSESDPDVIEAGLLLAVEKFGGQALHVRGQPSFQARVLQVAIERGINVRFADLAMEQLRQAGLEAKTERKVRDWSRYRRIAGGENNAGEQQRQADQSAKETTRQVEPIETVQARLNATVARMRQLDIVLKRTPPPEPNQEIVELQAITRYVQDFRAREIEALGPEPEKGGIFGLKGRAYQRDRDDIERRAERLEKDMMGDSAAAVDWRGKVWAKAEAAHAKELTAWREKRGAAIREGNDLRAQHSADKQRVDDHAAKLQSEQRQGPERRQEWARDRDRDRDRGPGMGR